MATREGIDAAITARLGADNAEPFFAVKAEFDTDDILVWSGTGDLSISSETYTGAGTLLTIGAIEEDTEISSKGIAVGLSYMDKTILNYALTESYQNRPITILLGFLMGGSNEIAGTMTVFKGRMQSMKINDTADGANIQLTAENRLNDLKRPRGYRYTNDSQQHLFSGDKGLGWIQTLQEQQVLWGRKSEVYGGSGGDDGSGGNYNIMR